jgi:internalin A
MFLEENPGLDLPSEIIESHDSRRIADYYFRTAAPGQRQALNEFKLILVGRGGVGKTTLVHRLVTGEFKEFKRTPGINITRWPMEIGGKTIRAHVWDFGGQEILHGTHRFFMTERALYLVLISAREDSEDHDAEYWLSLVRSFAGDVPVIVLLNKWDDLHFELNREELRRKYGQDLVFLETDAKSPRGMHRLDQHIRRLAKKLPALKDAWPTAWHETKTQLPEQKKDYLTYKEFCGFCCDCGIADGKDQEALAESLHDLGLMLAYRRDEALRDIGVLNPEWATQGIYRMLTAPVLQNAGGEFTVKTVGEVLPSRKYPSQLHPYLLALMRKFRLCHPLDDKGERHLIPQLLKKTEEPLLDAAFPPDQCLGFVYRYDAVLPEGLFPRFIVETYVHHEPKFVWRTGVVLQRANCRALVRGDIQGRKVTIRVTGPGGGRRELLGIIREHFERIHRSYERLPVTAVVPIPGFPEADVEHDLLLTDERSRRDAITVKIGDELQDFSVKQLLDGVDLPGVSRVRWAGRFADELQTCLFVSYSHKDERFRDEFTGALTVYERKGELTVWDDTKIVPGQKWEPAILGKLERADIIVLLLSSDFIRSDYCIQKEMKRAIERDAAGECAIIPIVIRACRFDKLEVGRIQAILPGGKAIKQHRDRDAAWQEVTKQLDRVLAELRQRRGH